MKVIQNLALKIMAGINGVTLTRNNKSLFVIEIPVVMKSLSSDVYIIIGPVKYKNLNQLAANIEAEKFKVEKAVTKEEPKIETAKEEEEESIKGMTEKIIQIFIDHCNQGCK